MLEHAIIIVLIIIASAYIITPLLKSYRFNGSLTPQADEVLGELNLKKESAYAAIRELEFDLNMGKLSKEDYENLRDKYTHDAIDYLKSIDELEKNKSREIDPSEKDLEEKIEREISTLRSSGFAQAADVFCTQCGQRASFADRFCSQCSAKLKS